MKMHLHRSYFKEGTNGTLFINGKFFCFTIELPWNHNKRNISCIPEGNYEIQTRFSKKYQHHLIIKNVKEKISNSINKGGSTQGLKHIIKSIDQELSDEDYWNKFAYHFDQVHGNYLKKLSNNNIRLSPREIKLAAFLRMNMSSKEISKFLNITTRGVELARYRLRKKLKLSRDQNLVEYLIDLDK